MQCPKCNNNLPIGSTYCPYCGSSFQEVNNLNFGNQIQTKAPDNYKMEETATFDRITDKIFNVSPETANLTDEERKQQAINQIAKTKNTLAPIFVIICFIAMIITIIVLIIMNKSKEKLIEELQEPKYDDIIQTSNTQSENKEKETNEKESTYLTMDTSLGANKSTTGQYLEITTSIDGVLYTAPQGFDKQDFYGLTALVKRNTNLIVIPKVYDTKFDTYIKDKKQIQENLEDILEVSLKEDTSYKVSNKNALKYVGTSDNGLVIVTFSNFEDKVLCLIGTAQTESRKDALSDALLKIAQSPMVDESYELDENVSTYYDLNKFYNNVFPNDEEE